MIHCRVEIECMGGIHLSRKRIITTTYQRESGTQTHQEIGEMLLSDDCNESMVIESLLQCFLDSTSGGTSGD